MIVDRRNYVEIIKGAWGAYNYEDGAGWDWVSRLADALEEAVEHIAELEDERDAALAELAKADVAFRSLKERTGKADSERIEMTRAIERVREAVEKHKHWNDDCGWDVPAIEVLAALDGAPEPEWEVQYGRRNRETGALHWLNGDPRDE